MIKEVEQYIEKYHMISPGDTIVVGVSGGADSVCLLLLLHEYRNKVPFSLRVVHVNHMIRAAAKEDAHYVEDLCNSLQLPFYLYEEKVEDIAKNLGISTEEAGRNVRYHAFEEVLLQNDVTGKIAVAHNQNDQAETVLFHLFRGTGLTGLSGILPVRDNIIRPLLSINRMQIEAYLKDRNVSWCIDVTNAEDTYTRNKIRNRILSYVENEIVTNAISHISATAEEMMQIRSFFEEETKKAMKEVVVFQNNEAFLQVSLFNHLPDIMQRQVLLACLERLTAGRKDIGSAHILAIQQLFTKSGSKEVHLPCQLEAVKQYENVRIRKRKSERENYFSREISAPEKFQLPDGRMVSFSVINREKDENIPQKSYTKWFDYDKILHCLVLRNRISGDYLTINNQMSTKKLKDYLIEEKVPREKRDSILVLADGQHILWTLGLRISEYYKVTEETKQILQVIVE